jgi:hypothetical protein
MQCHAALSSALKYRNWNNTHFPGYLAWNRKSRHRDNQQTNLAETPHFSEVRVAPQTLSDHPESVSRRKYRTANTRRIQYHTVVESAPVMYLVRLVQYARVN